jgi:hypothetical protein
MVGLLLISNVSTTTWFAPFKLNHGYMPQVDLLVNTDTTFKGVSQLAQQARWSLMAAHNAILAHHIDQTFHAIRKCHESEIYVVDDHVYLSTPNLTLRKGRARKLVLWHMGPYHMNEVHNKASTVTPEDLKNRCVLPTFHTNPSDGTFPTTMTSSLNR